MKLLLQSFCRGLLCPLDFSDPPLDTRPPFVALRPLPPREALEKTLEEVYISIREGLQSEEVKTVVKQWERQ